MENVVTQLGEGDRSSSCSLGRMKKNGRYMAFRVSVALKPTAAQQSRRCWGPDIIQGMEDEKEEKKQRQFPRLVHDDPPPIHERPS